MRPLEVRRLGRVPYADALQMQRALVEERRADRVPDVLLLLQHPAVITLGVKGDGGRSNIVATPERLGELGIEVAETGRGGDVTYHGPGQITGYPILDLSPDRKDVRRYVRDLEELMIRLAGSYGLSAGRVDKLNGTWIGDAKIGAVGVRISRWVTMHGFAFNVSTDLSHFGVIVPCGIVGKAVTSLERELGREVPMDEVLDHLEAHAADVFDAELVRATEPPLAGVDESAYEPDPWRDARA